VRALLGLSTVVVGALSNTRHRDLPSPTSPTCRARSYGTDRPPVTTGYKITAVLSESQDTARERSRGNARHTVERVTQNGSSSSLMVCCTAPCKARRWTCCFGLSLDCPAVNLWRGRRSSLSESSAARVRLKLSDHGQHVEQQTPNRICRVAHRPVTVQLTDRASNSSAIARASGNERATRPSFVTTRGSAARHATNAWRDPSRSRLVPVNPVIDIDPVRSDAQRGKRMKAFTQCICVAILLQRAHRTQRARGRGCCGWSGEGEGCPLGTDNGGTLD
jgi:hypothetical protein